MFFRSFYDHPKHIQKYWMGILSHGNTAKTLTLHLIFYNFEDTPHVPNIVFLRLQSQIKSSSSVINTYITVHCIKFKPIFS